MGESEEHISMDKPHLYTLASASFTAMAAKYVDELWPLLSWPRQPLPVIDVGCGPGHIAKKVLAPRLPPGTKLVACDISPNMVEFGRQHNAIPGTITYELLDVADRAVESSAVWQYAPFSKVFSFLMLHWVPDNRRAFRNINKLLAPGGEAVVSIIANSAFYTAYEEMSNDPRWAQYMQDVEKIVSPYHHCDDPVSVFSQLLKSEGFQVLRCEMGPQSVVSTSKALRREFLKSVCAFLNRIPEDQKDEFLDDWIQRSEKLNGISEDTENSEEPKYCCHITVMVAAARKL